MITFIENNILLMIPILFVLAIIASKIEVYFMLKKDERKLNKINKHPLGNSKCKIGIYYE